MKTTAVRTGTPATAASTLTALQVGDHARLLATRLAEQDGAILAALGLSTGCRLRVCRAGDPWIVQVQATRIGLADAIAHQIEVAPEP